MEMAENAVRKSLGLETSKPQTTQATVTDTGDRGVKSPQLTSLTTMKPDSKSYLKWETHDNSKQSQAKVMFNPVHHKSDLSSCAGS